ncbi:unnamed protein product, partial [Rotaria socialis]
VKLDLSVTDALSYGSEESSYLQHRNIDHLTYTSLQSISESLGLLPLDSSSSIISLSYQIEKGVLYIYTLILIVISHTYDLT